MKQIIIATKNKGKANEFKEFFSPLGIEAISLIELNRDIPDVEETGNTFEENAILKAATITGILQEPVLSDDSGLVIDALYGKPGVYSARYAGEPRNDQANIDKVLFEMKEVPEEKRTARFVCVLAIAIPGKETIMKKGFCEGKIANKQAGNNGFGYDPIFIPDGYMKTMAELAPSIKSKISHRRNAMNLLEKSIMQLVSSRGVFND